MKRLAVFGGGGFIGSHLCRRLVSEYSLDVIDIDVRKISDIESKENVTFHELDVRDESNDDEIRAIIDRCDTVIDLIAYANPQQYVTMPLEVVHLNYDMNMKLVEACVEADKRLIQFSTCEVYGKMGSRSDDEVVFREDTSDLIMGPVGNHRWIYATAKQLLERMVHAHGIENDLAWTIVRPFNFIGPEMDYLIESPDEGTPRVFASFMSALLHDHPMTLVDGGRNRRTFTYIRDAIDAIELVVKRDDVFNREIVNVGTPQNEATIREFSQLMREVYEQLSQDGTLPQVREVSGEEFYGPGYEDCERRVPDVSKLEEVGWTPSYNLRATVERSVQYYVDKYERRDREPSPDIDRAL